MVRIRHLFGWPRWSHGSRTSKLAGALSLALVPAAVLAWQLHAAASIPQTKVGGTRYAAIQNTALQQDAQEESPSKSDGPDSPDPTTASISPAQAVSVALAAFPGGKVSGTPTLEHEDGVSVYGINVTAVDGAAYDVKVDANAGKVIKADNASDDNGDQGDSMDSGGSD